MSCDLHHVHIFASDIDATVQWWSHNLGGKVVYDGDFGGARNVFMRIGRGGLNIYAQPPRGDHAGAIHHVGIRCDNLPETVQHMKQNGVAFRSEIREFGTWRYIMCAAPDDILLELFSGDDTLQPPEVGGYLRNEDIA